MFHSKRSHMNDRLHLKAPTAGFFLILSPKVTLTPSSLYLFISLIFNLIRQVLFMLAAQEKQRENKTNTINRREKKLHGNIGNKQQ